MKKLLFVIVVFFLSFFLYSGDKPLALSTENIDGIINITSFLSNNNGEIFLFSSTEGKVFKFKPNGKFEKSFCRLGQGPGEIQRVLFMYHNLANDFLYLPEYFSGQKRVTIFDSSGNYQGILKISLPASLMDKIWHLSFLEDGSFYLMLQDRIGWNPVGKLFTTQDRIDVKYFNQKGDFVADIYTMTMDDEMSSGPGWGGPQILFKPSVLMELTPQGHIVIAKTDDNSLIAFDRNGNKLKTIQLEISQEKLSQLEFQREKDNLVGLMRDPRMKFLAREMIKLDYKPIYSNIFLEKKHIILLKVLERDENYYVTKSELILFDWNGKKLGRKTIGGVVMNIQNGKIYIKTVDSDGNEYFGIESIESTDH